MELVLDLHSRAVVGWSMDARMQLICPSTDLLEFTGAKVEQVLNDSAKREQLGYIGKHPPNKKTSQINDL